MSLIHEISYQWFAYWWPSIKGNGPEALGQTALYGAIAVAVLPIVRKIIRNEIKRAHTDITGVEHELEKILPDLLKPVRWLYRKVFRVND